MKSDGRTEMFTMLECHYSDCVAEGYYWLFIKGKVDYAPVWSLAECSFPFRWP